MRKRIFYVEKWGTSAGGTRTRIVSDYTTPEISTSKFYVRVAPPVLPYFPHPHRSFPSEVPPGMAPAQQTLGGMATAASMLLALTIVKHGGEASARNELRCGRTPPGLSIHPVCRGMS